MSMEKGTIMPANRAKFEQAMDLMALGNRSQIEIVNEVGISKTQFYNWLKLKEFQDGVLERNIRMYKELIPEALNALKASLSSSNAKIKLDAAKIVLDRTMPDFNAEHGIGTPQILVQVNYV